MILKDREYPLKAQILEAVLRRLPTGHPKKERIENELGITLAGYHGEQSINYYLNFLPPENYLIMHDFRLKSPQNDTYFQIDTLILHPAFLLIIEVKNFAGKVLYDTDFRQIIRTYQNEEKAFPDPIAQVNHQRYRLQQWLDKNLKHTFIPIQTLVTLTNRQMYIQSSSVDSDIVQQIIRSEQLSSKILSLAEKYSQEKLSMKDLKKLSKTILKSHTPLPYNVFESMPLAKDDILRGVQCPNCFHIPMQRTYKQWICPNCQLQDREAHLYSIKDYCLIFTPTITNAQLRNFLAISSRHSAKRLLQSFNTTRSGTHKGSSYTLPFHQLPSFQKKQETEG